MKPLVYTPEFIRPSHLYMRFMKAIAIAFRPQSHVNGIAQKTTTSVANTWNYYLACGRGVSEPNLPPAGETRELYLKLTSNLMRMWLWLMLDELTTTKQTYDLEPLDAVPTLFATVLAKAGGSGDAAQDQRDLDLLARVRDAKATVCISKPLGYKQAPYPGHCSYK